MPAITILIGVMLILVGVGGFGWASAYDVKVGESVWKNATALIPSVIGLIIAACGALATNEKRRKNAMHAAVGVALLGLIAVLARLVPSLVGGIKNSTAFVSQAITAILLLILIALGVNSFVRARRK
jgi:uncharacterized membrane protein